MNRRLILGIVVLLIVLAGVTFTVAMSTRPQICVVSLAPVEQGENASEQLEPMKCFDNLADVAAYQTNGVVQLPRDVSDHDYTVAVMEWQRQQFGESGEGSG